MKVEGIVPTGVPLPGIQWCPIIIDRKKYLLPQSSWTPVCSVRVVMLFVVSLN